MAAAYDRSKVFKKKNKVLEEVPALFEASVEKYQRTLFNDLLKLLDRLKRDSGGLMVFNSKDLDNLAIIDIINSELKDILLSGEYLKSVKDFSDEFDKLADVNNEYFKTIEDFKSSLAADEALNIAKRGTVEKLIGESLDANFLLPIKSALEDAVTSGASWVDTVQSIRDFVEGNEDADGRLLQYAKQIAKDEFSIADRSYTNQVSEELDLEFYIWSGQLITTTRCFCRERANKYFHFKEIEAWARGENLGDCDTGDGTWAGEREGTNEQTIYVYAGGYNCNHAVMPLSVSNVPKDVIRRAIDAGYYQPTEKEAEMLGV